MADESADRPENVAGNERLQDGARHPAGFQRCGDHVRNGRGERDDRSALLPPAIGPAEVGAQEAGRQEVPRIAPGGLRPARSSALSPAATRTSGRRPPGAATLARRVIDCVRDRHEAVAPAREQQVEHVAEVRIVVRDEDQWAALTKQPEDRAEIVDRTLQQVDARLISFYYCHGKYDGLMIFEAPDDVVTEAVPIAGVGAGHLKDLEVTRLLSVEESLSAMRIAGRGKLPVPAGAESELNNVAIHRQDEME